MKTIRTICLAALALAVTAAAADVSGKWTGKVPTRGEEVTATFTFKVEGEKLTGTMTGPRGEVQLQDGKAAGDKISFSAAGGNARILFEGKLAGEELKMTRTREGGQSREFTLKRSQ